MYSGEGMQLLLYLGFLRRVRMSHQHLNPRSLRSLRHQRLPIPVDVARKCTGHLTSRSI